MYFHKQIFKSADVIVSPMTGYYYYLLLLQLSSHFTCKNGVMELASFRFSQV